MTHEEFLSRVAEHTGLSGMEEVGRVVRTVLGVLGERLGEPVFQAGGEPARRHAGACLPRAPSGPRRPTG